jgi:hypothetical protein
MDLIKIDVHEHVAMAVDLGAAAGETRGEERRGEPGNR